MESFARGDLFWVSDSNIRVGTTTLKSLIEPYVNNGIHLIFSPIKGEGSRTFGSLMENSYLNHYLSGNVLSAWNFFKQEIVVGKSMLIEKEALMSFGGFSYFKDFIAEDQIMGETFRKSGYKIATNNTWVTNFNQTSSINSFYNRMSRWAKLRFSMHRGIYFAEIVTNTTAMIMLAIGILRDKFVIFILPLLLFRILLEMITYYVIDETEQYKKTNMLLLPFAIIFKELLLIFVWFTPFFSNHIRWRGGKIAIAKRSVISNSLYAIFVESF
jgi:ceramide glucosyltransferase